MFSFLSDEDVSLLKPRAESSCMFLMTSASMIRAELLDCGLSWNNELISNHCVQEGQRLKQQVLSLRRENGTLDAEVHDKERLVNQLQMKVAVLEQEVKDKEQLMRRTKEVLEAAQQQKVRDTHLLQPFSWCAAPTLKSFLNVFGRNLWRKMLKVKKFRLKSWKQR